MTDGLVRAFNTEPRESVLEAWYRDTVRALGGRAYKFTAPGRRSVPDRLTLFPGKRVFFVELKRQGKKLTPKQAIEHAFLRSLGFSVYTCDTKQKCVDVLVLEGVWRG